MHLASKNANAARQFSSLASEFSDLARNFLYLGSKSALGLREKARPRVVVCFPREIVTCPFRRRLFERGSLARYHRDPKSDRRIAKSRAASRNSKQTCTNSRSADSEIKSKVHNFSSRKSKFKTDVHKFSSGKSKFKTDVHKFSSVEREIRSNVLNFGTDGRRQLSAN